AGLLLNSTNATHQQEGNLMHYTIRQPIGIVGCIASCHMPLYGLCKKIAPALAMGNCVIVKVSQFTPLTAYLLAKDLEKTGLPKGVLNIIQGNDHPLVDQIVEHPKIRAIAFTGEPEIGKKIIQDAASKGKKLAINIGGNNPNIIFEDCDFDQMMLGTLRSSFSNNGQRKHHTSRILVQRDLYENFKKELVKRAQFIKIGDPFARLTDLGALLSQKHLENIESAVKLVELEGGKVLCGGERVMMEGELEKGYFMRPTVVEGLDNDSFLNQEEIFGPLVTLQIFDTEEEALKLANATKYGTSAAVWTRDISKANRFTNQLKAKN
ncbi:MAG: aldehyde dehydrogenase family protein, partial [Bacteroidota bacterium]